MKDDTALAVAQKMGLHTLESYVKNHPPFKSFVTGNFGESQIFWENASKAFSEFATGKVTVLLSPKRAADLRKGDKSSVWAKVEGPGVFTKMKFAFHRAKNAVKGALGMQTPNPPGPNPTVTKVVKVIVDSTGRPSPEIPMDSPFSK